MHPDRNRNDQREASRQRARERADAAERERPEPHKVGVLSVVDAVRDLEFPLTFNDVRSTAGEREVRTSGDKAFPLSRVLERVGEQLNENDPLDEGGRVGSLQDFQRVVQRHWDAVEWMETPREQRPQDEGPPPGPRSD